MAVGVHSAVRPATKDRLTLAYRLRLHKQLQPAIAWANRNSYWFAVAPTASILPALFADRHSQALWPCLLPSLLFTYMAMLMISYKIWRANIVRIAKSNNIAAVAPLLDFASATVVSHAAMIVSPISLSEAKAVVLTFLPDLLARMSAGDGPGLTAAQRSALVQIVCSPKYTMHFSAPELRAKIDRILQG